MRHCDCRIGCLSGSVTRVGGVENELSGIVTRIGKGLSGYASIICSVSKDAYLEVSTDVLWLTPDMLGEEFDIYSNVSWKIETEDMDNGGGGHTIMSMLENSTYMYNEYYLKNSV